jgi:hypothetical protein
MEKFSYKSCLSKSWKSTSRLGRSRIWRCTSHPSLHYTKIFSNFFNFKVDLKDFLFLSHNNIRQSYIYMPMPYFYLLYFWTCFRNARFLLVELSGHRTAKYTPQFDRTDSSIQRLTKCASDKVLQRDRVISTDMELCSFYRLWRSSNR